MKLKLKSIFSIIGTIAGLMSIRYSFVIKKASTGGYEYSSTYGGDAYTGIQNAAAQTANNVQDMAEILRNGFSYVLLIAGLLAVCYFLSELVEDLGISNVADVKAVLPKSGELKPLQGKVQSDAVQAQNTEVTNAAAENTATQPAVFRNTEAGGAEPQPTGSAEAAQATGEIQKTTPEEQASQTTIPEAAAAEAQSAEELQKTASEAHPRQSEESPFTL